MGNLKLPAVSGTSDGSRKDERHRPLDESPARLPRWTRRGLLIGGGVTTTALLLPRLAYAQFDIRPLELTFVEQRRAADTLTFIERWYANFELAEQYGRERKEAAAEDRAALTATANYLQGTLKARVEDVNWFAQLTNKQPEAFQRVALSSIEQSPVRDREKAEILGALSEQTMADRASKLVDRAPPVIDGIETSLRRSTEATGVPRVEDQQLRSQWLCIALGAMLSGALASSQWYLVASITLRMKSVGCLLPR